MALLAIWEGMRLHLLGTDQDQVPKTVAFVRCCKVVLGCVLCAVSSFPTRSHQNVRNKMFENISELKLLTYLDSLFLLSLRGHIDKL